MAKSSRPDRRRNDRGGRREPSEFSEATLSIDRVTRVVKGGRRMRFRAVVVIGNRKGKVGLGTGKAAEVQAAVKKAVADARRNMIRVPIVDGTIPHEVQRKFKSAKLLIMPAMPGTGIIAGGALRVILDHAGVKNVLSKRFGSRNKLVNAQAAILALQMLRSVGGVVQDAAPVGAAEEKGSLVVKEASKSEVEKQNLEAKRNTVGE